ncbi:MAG: 4'-phosphopantetheinyl transferase superfamily protein [Acidimicrobiaceae bacterium]|nr:4'-phosphopantetheinyl transferase superfamily protein [Acidimicrobiaceae bacterium]
MNVACPPAVQSGGWWRPLAAFDGVAVLHVDLAPDALNEQRAWAWLDPAERQRADQFRHGGAKRQYVLCRSALRSLLCDALSCRNEQLAFRASKHGKPSAFVGGSKSAFGFNVSHGGRHGLIALAPDGTVGVDVEERSAPRNLDVLVDTVLSPGERAEVMAAAGDEKLRLFLNLWTMKEALSKARGVGMSMDVSGFEIPHGMLRGTRGGVFCFPDVPDLTWALHNVGTDDFAAAVACTTQAVCDAS